VLTGACAVVAIGAGCFNLLHLGFEFVGVFGSLFFKLAALTGLVALLTAVVRALLGAKGGNAWIVQISVVSLLLLGAVFTFPESWCAYAATSCWTSSARPCRERCVRLATDGLAVRALWRFQKSSLSASGTGNSPWLK